jgi:glycosyltransferase involved in cell wall biosynthesis
MGYPFLIQLLSELKQMGVHFEARIVGAGPLLSSIREHISRERLTGEVELLGKLPFEEVKVQYAWADLFLFTGEVARDGDRAGFPNAVGEAMAWGVPVAARPVGGVAEVIKPGENGLIIEGSALFGARQVRSLLLDRECCRLFQERAREWVLREFQAQKNVVELVKRIEANERPPAHLDDISKT